MPKKKNAALILRGRYLGLIRHAKKTIQAKAKKLNASKGVRVAIKFLKSKRA